MTIDRESLRPAFERRLREMWHCDELGLEPDGNGGYRDPDVAVYWTWWCAAFESLGEPYMQVKKWGVEGYKEFPLYRLPEVKA